MFAIRLKELRENAELSQKALAKKLYVSQQTIAKWELNKSTPNPEMLCKIAMFFNVSADYLIGNKRKLDFKDINLSENDYKLLEYYHRLNQEDQEWIRGKMIDAFKQYNQSRDMETALELDANITEDIINLTKSQNKGKTNFT